MDQVSRKILLIEDDKDDYVLLRSHLSKINNAHYELEWEPSYKNGLIKLLQNKHDLYFVDYQLGERNGIELIKEARAKGHCLPIILLTGLSNPEMDIQALQVGADDYLAKGHIVVDLLDRAIQYAIERKKSENERERFIREQVASKILDKRKDEFMGIVSHELKTPVTSLKAFAQVLHNRFIRSGDEASAQLLKKMDTQINKLTSLIGDLLDVTKMEGGKLQFHNSKFDFDEIVDEIIEEIQRTTTKHSIVRKGFAKKTIYGDRDRIGQVIINLLTNAIKYSPHTNEIFVHTAISNESVKLCVQDFGVGIPEDKQSQVFLQFYRVSGVTHDTVPGIGLGLYISSEIIRRQGGTIDVKSEQGKGATFCFTVPIKKRSLRQQKNKNIELEIKHT